MNTLPLSVGVDLVEIPRIRRWAWPIPRTKIILDGDTGRAAQDLAETLELAGVETPTGGYWWPDDALRWLLARVAEVGVEGPPMPVEEEIG